MKRHEFLRGWRTDAGVSIVKLASLTGLDPATIEGIEAGTHEPSFDELDAIAAVLGLRAEDIYDDEVSASAATDGIRLLMKSAVAYRPPDSVRVQMLGAAAAARDLIEFDSVDRPPTGGFEKLTTRPPQRASDAPYKVGDEYAREFRKQFAVDGSIPSMRDLVQDTLGIPIIGANLASYGPDAFSLYTPNRRAVIVLNLQGKNTHALVRRFSIAHEIGHVLYDRPVMGAFGVACQVDPARGLETESRANAFAMRLLLPYPAVKKLGDTILEPSVFRDVMITWGVHFSALHLYVEKLLNLSRDEAKTCIPEVDRSSPNRWTDAEELVEERHGLRQVPACRRGALARTVFDALRNHRISPARARELLGIDATVRIEDLATELDVQIDQD